MTKEELIELANKVREGNATPEERSTFFAEFKAKLADLKDFVATLPKKE
jgi:hypothetical protein